MITPRLDSAPRFRSLKAIGRRVTGTTGASPVLTGVATVAALAAFGATPALAGNGPIVDTGQATNVTASSAVLHGTANLRGSSGSYYFRWGSNDSYDGRTAAQSLPASGSVQAATATISGLKASTQYHVRLVAVTSSGAQSRGDDVTFTTSAPGDSQAPSAPALLGKTGATETSISLSWSASSDDRGVTGYEVLQGDTVVKTVTGTSATVDGLASGTAYTFTVRAFDAAGNRSAQSTPLSANTLTPTPPPPPPVTVPVVTTDSASDITSSGATLYGTTNLNGSAGLYYFQWGTTTHLGTQSSLYDLPASSSPQAGQTTVSGLSSDTTYYFRIVSNNSAGYTTGPMKTFHTSAVAPPPPPPADTQAPSTPASLNAGSPTQSSLQLTWNASNDNVGVAGYRVSKNGTQIASVTGSSYTATGLDCGATYGFTVVAFDAAGNVSPAASTNGTTANCPVTNARYVSPTGNDANDGSALHPFQTIQRAINLATAGQTILVRGGTYGGFTFNGVHGTSSSPITVAAYPGENPVVDGRGAAANVIDVRSGASFVAIQGLQVTGGPADNNHAAIMVENCSHDVTISDNLITNNGAFGVRVYGLNCTNAMNVDIDGNTIQHNGTGVRLDYDSLGNQITNNQLINNDHLLVNDATPGNDNGANGTQFFRTHGATLVAGNIIHGNRGPSHDYREDGGAFEIFGASDLDIQRNTVWDNVDILETGTNNGYECANNQFTDNIAYGGNDKSVVPTGIGLSLGILLRCASNMLIANNTIDDLDNWVYDIQQNGNFVGSLAGLHIQNNVITMHNAKVYAFQVALPAGSVIDHEDLYVTGSAPIATVTGKGNAYDLATLRTWTGTGQHDVSVDPQFSNAGGRDYHLRSSSPVIDLGSPISGVTDGFLGAAPDLGRFEAR